MVAEQETLEIIMPSGKEMSPTEALLMQMLKQQQAINAMLIARLGMTEPKTIQEPVPSNAMPVPPKQDNFLPRMKIADLVPLFTQFHRGQVKESTRLTFVNGMLKSYWTKNTWGERYIDEMDWITLQNWLDSLDTHTRYLRDYMRDLTRLINWARERHKCQTPPEFPRKLTFKRVESRHGEELDEETFQKLHSYSMEHYAQNIGAAAALIAMHTGLRIGEVCGLRNGDIDWENGTLTIARTVQRCYDSMTRHSMVVIGTPKTRCSARTIPLDDTIAAILRELCQGLGNDDYVLHDGKNGDRGYEPRNLRSYYESMLKKGHIEHFNFHSLRHTFVSRHIRAGANVKAVSAYVGHADVKMTLGIYTHVNNDDLRKVVSNNGGSNGD